MLTLLMRISISSLNLASKFFKSASSLAETYLRMLAFRERISSFEMLGGRTNSGSSGDTGYRWPPVGRGEGKGGKGEGWEERRKGGGVREQGINGSV